MLPDQRTHWNKLYGESDANAYPDEPSTFAREVADLLVGPTTILELGCGAGRDAAFFARAGHTVVGVDFSDVAINRHRSRHAGLSGPRFIVANLADPLPFPDASFGVVYARLSLHYFPDRLTRQIFGRIGQVLAPNGLLAYLCKSERDPLYGKGDPVERDMYVYRGHVRHFFTEEYARDCLPAGFTPIEIARARETREERISAFVKVVARKTF